MKKTFLKNIQITTASGLKVNPNLLIECDGMDYRSIATGHYYGKLKFGTTIVICHNRTKEWIVLRWGNSSVPNKHYPSPARYSPNPAH